MRETYGVPELREMLVLMVDKPNAMQPIRYPEKPEFGEGWLERNRQATSSGIDSEWRIAPSVLPLLHFLLMSCPEDDRCR